MAGPNRLALCAALVLAGCPASSSDDDDARPAARAQGRLTPRPPFNYADVANGIADEPVRFSSPIPLDVRRIDSGELSIPPGALVRSRLCHGDIDMRRRVLAAMEQAAVNWDVPDLADSYATVLSSCSHPSWCPWLAGIVQSDASPRVRDTVWFSLAECADPALRPLFERADAPAGAVVNWASRFPEGIGTFPRLFEAFEALRRGGEPAHVRAAAITLGRRDDPLVATTLVRAYGRTRHPLIKQAIAAGMVRQTEPRARRIFAAYCADEPDVICSLDAPATTDQEIEDKVVENPMSSWNLYTADGTRRSALVEGLSRCAEGPDGEDLSLVYVCLRSLAQLERPRAADKARGLRGGQNLEAMPTLHKLADELVRYPTAEELVAAVKATGIIDDATPHPKRAIDAPAVTVVEVLYEHGRLVEFSTESMRSPVDYDALLFDLAVLAPAAVGDVLFEQELIGDEYESQYVLRAYADGQVWATSATDLGSYYDADAVVGLLNAVARARGRDERFVTTVADEGTVQVAAARGSALLRARAEGLLPFSLSGDSADPAAPFDAPADPSSEW